MNSMNSNAALAANLVYLRKQSGMSQEKVAEAVGVSRQAVAKWETGESAPDIMNCDALATLYKVSLDDLVHFDESKYGYPIPPKDKHLFGTVQIGERGQIVIPKKARDVFGLKHGDELVVLGDTTPGTGGIALVPGEAFMQMTTFVMDHIYGKKEEE